MDTFFEPTSQGTGWDFTDFQYAAPSIEPLSYVPCSFIACHLILLRTGLTSARPGSKKAVFTTKKLPIQYSLHNLHVQQREITSIIPLCHLHSYTQLLFPKGNTIFIFKHCFFCLCLSFYPYYLNVFLDQRGQCKSFSEWLPDLQSLHLLEHHRQTWNKSKHNTLTFNLCLYEESENMHVLNWVMRVGFIFAHHL